MRFLVCGRATLSLRHGPVADFVALPRVVQTATVTFRQVAGKDVAPLLAPVLALAEGFELPLQIGRFAALSAPAGRDLPRARSAPRAAYRQSPATRPPASPGGVNPC